MNFWINLLGFQLVWMVTVGGAARGLWWAGLPVLAVFALWQWRVSRVPKSDMKLVAIAAVLGFAIDSAFAAAQWLHYQSPLPWATLAPVWILVLWVAFALTLNHSMQFLRGKMLWAVLFGAAGGPIAYLIADHVWGAVRIEQPGWPVLVALAIAWAVVTPALVECGRRLSRAEEVPA
jgi:hypothetical protein